MKTTTRPLSAKLPILFCIIGGGITALICAYNLLSIPGGHQGYPDFKGFLMILVEYPTIVISRIFGKSGNWLVNDSGQFAIGPACLAILVNSILGIIIGMLLNGFLLKRKAE